MNRGGLDREVGKRGGTAADGDPVGPRRRNGPGQPKRCSVDLRIAVADCDAIVAGLGDGQAVAGAVGLVSPPDLDPADGLGPPTLETFIALTRSSNAFV